VQLAAAPRYRREAKTPQALARTGPARQHAGRASGVAGTGIIVDGASAAWQDERDTATRRRPLAQWLAVLAILCAGCGGGATGDTGKSAAARERRPDQVLALALRVGDPAYIIDAINEAAPHDARVDDAVLGLLREVWAGNRQKFPRLAWAVLALPEVRMAVADPLVLASRSHRIEIDTAEMRALALAHLADGTVQVASRAVLLLGDCGARGDVPRLGAIAARPAPNDALSKPALEALGQICGVPAERVLEAQYDLAHGDRRQLIHSIISARQRMLTNRCDDRI
jgi:hypothetical protein